MCNPCDCVKTNSPYANNAIMVDHFLGITSIGKEQYKSKS